MNTNLNEYKERVKKLRKAVSSVLNVECTQSQAYELMAKEDNYPNWDALSGCINKQSVEIESSPLTTKEQITQLFLVHSGLRNGYPLYNILPFLKEQNNPVIKNGWSKVNMESVKDFHEIFVTTNFFSDEVLTILKMSSGYSIESGIHSAIEYLKMT